MDAARKDAGQPARQLGGQHRQAGSRGTDPGAADAGTADSGTTCAGETGTSTGLTPREHEVLAFERKWWKYQGVKERAVREHFNMSSTRYYQVLNTLLDKPEAMESDPMLVKRLLRMRASRQRKRTARKLGIELT